MNLFLPVYKRIEEDVVKLTETIFFDDKQLTVYSLAIGDLLIRCVIEVEAISKELYLRLGGVEKPLDDDGNERDLYFDTDCINLLVDTWGIDKKKLQITNPNMYFSQEKAVLTPLHKSHKRGTSSSQWQQAYQAVKHYRTRSVKKATIENLLNALGALYILNLYYDDESFWVETPIKDRREYTIDSKIFTPFICDATHISMSPEMGDDSMRPIEDPTAEESIYVLKLTEEVYRAIHADFCKYHFNIFTKVQLSEEYKEYIKEHPEEEMHSIDKICEDLGVNYISFLTQETRIVGGAINRFCEKEAVLVKGNGIYPTLTYNEFLDSEDGKKYMEELIVSLQGKKIVLPKD
jgi:hypothetical protein